MVLWKCLGGAQTCIHYREESRNPTGKSEGKIGDWIRFSFLTSKTSLNQAWATMVPGVRVAHGKQAVLVGTVC